MSKEIKWNILVGMVSKALILCSVSCVDIRANAGLFTFSNSSYTFSYDSSFSNSSFLSYSGKIYGSFEFNPSASYTQFSNVDVAVGGYPGGAGSYWYGATPESGANWLQAGGGYGYVIEDYMPLSYNQGSASNAVCIGQNCTQKLYFWYFNAQDLADPMNGRGMSIQLNSTLLAIGSGSVYQSSANTAAEASNNYFCNAVLSNNGNSLATDTGAATGCATDVAGATPTTNVKPFSTYSLSLAAQVPAPALGLGLIPMLSLLRRRKIRTK